VTATRKSRQEAKQPAKVQKLPTEMEQLANHAADQLAAAEEHMEYEMEPTAQDTTLRITFMIYEQGS
jgi:hypothetical protein